MRRTGRLVGTKEDTVIRYARLAGRHAAGLHDELVALPPATEEPAEPAAARPRLR